MIGEGKDTMEAAQKTSDDKPVFSEYDYSNFYYGAGDDPLNLLRPYADWYRESRPAGYYLYMEALQVRAARTRAVRERQDLKVLPSSAPGAIAPDAPERRGPRPAGASAPAERGRA